jgi:hypothetical protein
MVWGESGQPLSVADKGTLNPLPLALLAVSL